MKKNDILQLTIDSVSSDGSGVGRWEGMAVFVPFTAPGDLCEVKIVKVLRSYAFGICTKVVAPGPGRQEKDCPAFGRCGGCVLRHLTYPAELAVKQKIVAGAFARLGGFAEDVLAGLASPEGSRYRNKVQ